MASEQRHLSSRTSWGTRIASAKALRQVWAGSVENSKAELRESGWWSGQRTSRLSRGGVSHSRSLCRGEAMLLFNRRPLSLVSRRKLTKCPLRAAPTLDQAWMWHFLLCLVRRLTQQRPQASVLCQFGSGGRSYPPLLSGDTWTPHRSQSSPCAVIATSRPEDWTGTL